MNKLQPRIWVSYYLYYSADPETLLASTVSPLIRQLAEKRLISQFFFIRYADSRGPHIRLRLLPANDRSRKSVIRYCKQVFPDAKFVAYIPEIERYGGAAGVPIAEQLFQASSAATLQLLAQDKAWNYNRALASALQMHIGMLQTFGLDKVKTAALCKHIAEVETRQPIDLLEPGFATQRETVAPQLAALWAACERKENFGASWFAQWRQTMAEVGRAMHRAHKLQKLELVHGPRHMDPLWYLYESYIHMTNNRLGLVRQDEAFAAYVLYRSLL